MNLDQNVWQQWNDTLPVLELGISLERASNNIGKKIACLVFDNCLPSNLEVLCEISESVSTAVFSSSNPLAGQINISQAVDGIIDEMGVMSDKYIARTFAQSYEAISDEDHCIAVDLKSQAYEKSLENLRIAFSGLTKWLDENEQNQDAFRNQLNQCFQKYMMCGEKDSIIDVFYVIQTLMDINEIPKNIKATLTRFLNNINTAIIHKTQLNENNQEVGLYLYAPTDRQEYLYNRPYYVRSKFSSITNWNRILDFLYLDKSIQTLSWNQIKEEV